MSTSDLVDDGKDVDSEKPLKEELDATADQSQNSFDALERDFREVLTELVGDKSLERFRVEYEKLHTALKRSHGTEMKLIRKCRELNDQLQENSQKVQRALRMARADQNNIGLLRKEIDSAWKIVDSAQEKEKKARETIAGLKAEIGKLSHLVDQGAGLSIGQENVVNDLIREKKALEQELDTLKHRAAADAERIQQLSDDKHRLESDKSDLEQQLHDTKQSEQQNIVHLTNEKYQTASLKNQTAKLLAQLKDERKSLDMLKENNVQLSEHQKVLENELAHQEALTEKLSDATESALHDRDQAQEELRIRTNQLQLREQDLEGREAEVKRLKQQLLEQSRMLDDMRRKSDRLQEERERMSRKAAKAEAEFKSLKQSIDMFQKDVEAQVHNADTDEKLIGDLRQQVMRQSSSLQMAKEKNKRHLELVKRAEKEKQDLKDKIIEHKKREERLKKAKTNADKERDAIRQKAQQLTEKLKEGQDLLRLKDTQIQDRDKKVEEEKRRLKLQQTLYEQVRTERNLFSKQHIQSQDEIAEMKRKFLIMAHQIQQLQQEIKSKDLHLVNEHYNYKRAQQENGVQKRKLQKRDEVLKTADQVLASQDAEIRNLRQALQEADSAQRRQKSVYDDAVQQRDMVLAQLVRRNDELALLYEKVRIQQSTLSKGELQYRERLQEINLLKLTINEQKRELLIKSSQGTNIEALKAEIHHMQRELLQERTKVKALAEELENPMNVHRWRRLDGSDPKRFELIQKVQMLQKRLIAKTEEVVEKDLLLQEKERLYQELKNILARQPGPEVAEQLSVYQQALKEKTRQMKGMAAELNMLQAQVNEYRFELDRVTREYQDKKSLLYKQKKKEQEKKERRKEEMGFESGDPLLQQQRNFLTSQPRIAGGGFNLTQTQAQITKAQAQAQAHTQAQAQAQMQMEQQQQQYQAKLSQSMPTPAHYGHSADNFVGDAEDSARAAEEERRHEALGKATAQAREQIADEREQIAEELRGQADTPVDEAAQDEVQEQKAEPET